jgi:hypothetical protein
VYGLSRRPADSEGNVRHISIDLLGSSDIKAKLGSIRKITHLFFGAYVDKQNAAEKSAINVQLLKGPLQYLSEKAPNLQHVTIFQGGKAYGSDLGRIRLQLVKTTQGSCPAAAVHSHGE